MPAIVREKVSPLSFNCSLVIRLLPRPKLIFYADQNHGRRSTILAFLPLISNTDIIHTKMILKSAKQGGEKSQKSGFIFSAMKLTIFFDIGNVLINVKPLIHSACYFAARECDVFETGLSRSSLAETYLEMDRKIHHLHMNHLFGDRIIIDAVLQEILKHKDARISASFLTSYRSYIRNEIQPNDELTSFFKSLVSDGKLNLELGVISDGTIDDQLETLVRLSIIKYFHSELLLISEAFGQEKTNDAIFEEAIARSRNNRHRIVMIGDNLDRDIKNAMHVGIIPIYFDRYVDTDELLFSQLKPFYRAHDFRALVSILHSISERF